MNLLPLERSGDSEDRVGEVYNEEFRKKALLVIVNCEYINARATNRDNAYVRRLENLSV